MQLKVIKQYDHLPQLAGEMRIKANLAVNLATFAIGARARASMQPPKHGMTYRRGQKTHTASAPGEAPAIDTGNLVNSVREDFPADLTGMVFTNTQYGAYLEFGTHRMAARPWLVPAAEAEWPAFIAALTRIVNG